MYTKHKHITTRKILISFLCFVILMSIAAFFVRNSINEKLKHTAELTMNNKGNKSKLARVVLLIHEADNDFEGSLISNNVTGKNNYKVKLSTAFMMIDTLLKEKIDTKNLTLLQKYNVKLLSGKKIILSDKLYALKQNFDSLLAVYANFNVQSGKQGDVKIPDTHIRKSYMKASSDTVKREVQKSGLMKRLKEALANKKASTQGIAEIRSNNYDQQNEIIIQKSVTENKLAYINKLKNLQKQNVRLLDAQRQLFLLNSHIINEMDAIINTIKDINYKMSDDFKEMALKSYQESTSLLNKLYLIASFLVLCFAALLIVFITQLNRSESQLHQEIERSAAIAQQKMELLHHMSHEIRNPLTAIRGFLYIFSKSNMSFKQIEMLESITLSSDMMLRTLTDTLDAAKMESSELKISIEPFNPDFVLKKVVESMSFSATKKKLALQYNFSNKHNIVLLGDSFRLKQIVINLLSNAIKYTEKGSISVDAELMDLEGRLKVDITDTGVGISLEQQLHLFTKYYQTNSSKGKMGTGLGLFICKQLVEMQNGEISVKSIPDRGTTLSFFIPYQKAEESELVKATINDPLSSLTGKHILAVDDNELNLMLLRKIMQKWNITFHQASNGKEALNYISENLIDIVLTDLQMPEMDGQMLLINMKKLKEPANQIPVIIISGSAEHGDKEKFLDMGFTGILSKPFLEADLLEQLIIALK